MDEQKEKKLQMPCEPTLARAPALGHPNYKLPFPSLCLKTEDTSWVYSLRGTVTTGCYSCQLDLVAEGLPPSRRAISATALFMQSYWRNFSWGLLSESLDLLRSIVTLITQYYFRLLVLTALTLQLCFQHLKMTALYWLSFNWGLMCKKFPLIILDLIWFTGTLLSWVCNNFNSRNKWKFLFTRHQVGPTSWTDCMTRACQLARGQINHVYTDSCYAFGVARDFTMLWKPDFSPLLVSL